MPTEAGTAPLPGEGANADAPARFVVVEHSIKRLGGHHLGYAQIVLAAAASHGFRPVLATHRRYRGSELRGTGIELRRVFRDTVYDFLRRDRQSAELAQASPRSPLARLRRTALSMAMRRSAGRFASDLERLLRGIEPRTSDVVFLSTVGRGELAAIADAVRDRRLGSPVPLHAMLHFPPGRQEADDVAMAGALRAARASGMHLWATTEELAASLAELGDVPVGVLPWAVDPRFAIGSFGPRASNPGGPVRLSVPGSARDERGTNLMDGIVGRLCPRIIDGRRAQLVIQSKRLAKLPPRIRQASTFHGNIADAARSDSPVAVVKWPLSHDEYVCLVRQSGSGLLLYDAARYRDRASGVLVEMLSAGVPVIVLAGSWLGRQFRDASAAHAELLLRRAAAVGGCGTIVPATSDPARAALETGGLELGSMPNGATHLAIEMSLEPSGGAAMLSVGPAGHAAVPGEPAPWRELVEAPGAGPSDGVHHVVFLPIVGVQGKLTLRIAELRGRSPLRVRGMRVHAVDGARIPGGCPLGAVGLQAADMGMVDRLIEELVDNHAHYRQTAEEFAHRFAAIHSPTETVRRLVERSMPSMRE